jgi:predicted ATPase/DNA-binding winged helix-turn-helix (wHTH) protein
MQHLHTGEKKERDQTVFGFGSFRLLPRTRQLLENDRVVRLGSRAMDLLLALVERSGEMVSKSELIAYTWPNEVVEENTLRVHIAAVRKALGDGRPGVRYIINSPGRGYCFVGEVQRQRPTSVPATAFKGTRSRLPANNARLLGREDSVAGLERQLRQHRFITIVAPGGMGKTAVAIAVAEAAATDFALGAWFVDLTGVAEHAGLTAALASTLEIANAEEDTQTHLRAWLADKQLLLVVDNCEHLVGGLAPLLDGLLDAAPGLRILATSREPIRAAQEWVHLLPAMAVPPVSAAQAAEVAAYPAAQLFVERASAADDTFQLSDANARAVSDICRQLDGAPLAIELVAAMVRTFGMPDLSAGFDARLLAMKAGHGAPRHQSLGAMLTWSWQLLQPTERAVLHRLSVFREAMTLDAAAAVAGGDGIEPDAVRQAVYSLVSRSWLTPDASSEPVRFRMHNVAKSFADERLKAEGALEATCLRHADFLESVMKEARSEWLVADKHEWLTRYIPYVHDIRAAISWMLTRPDGGLRACELLDLGWMLGLQSHQVAEFESLAAKILHRLELEGSGPLPAMRMHRALSLLPARLIRPAAPSQRFHSERTLALIDAHGSAADRLDALMTRFVHSMTAADMAQALDCTTQLGVAARQQEDPVIIVVADRMSAQAHHFMGQHERARALAERVMHHPIKRGAFAAPSGPVDHRVSMRIVLLRVLWMQGFTEQADEVCSELLELAPNDGTISLCQAIAFGALPLALWCGRERAARDLATMLRKSASNQTHDETWRPWADAADALLDPSTSSTEILQRFERKSLLADHLCTFREDVYSENTLRRVEAGLIGWCGPEALRQEGERLALLGQIAGARTILDRGLALARKQGALAWELRCAISLARWERQSGLNDGLLALLAAVHARFTEGWETRDLQLAQAELDQGGVRPLRSPA